MIAIALAGCTEYGLDERLPEYAAPNPPEPPVIERVDRILQVVEPKVDVLWIVDNSPSMVEDRQQLAQAFPEFVAWFAEAPVDWHLGVITTDMESEGHQGALQERGGWKYLTRDTPDPEAVFTRMVTELDGVTLREEGREAAWVAIDRLGETDNAGFLHDDTFAWLHFTVVSDEDDDSDALTVEQFADWARFLRPYEGHVTFNSVVSLADTGLEDRGDAYLALTEALGGVRADLNRSEWPTLLASLGGLQMPPLSDEFFLSALPLPETLDVHVTNPDGTVFSFLPDDFTWSPTRNSVRFTTFEVPIGSMVEIRYLIAAG